MTFSGFYSSKSWCNVRKNRFSNFEVINSFLKHSHQLFDYFTKHKKKAAKSEKKANCELFIKAIETERFINYYVFFQTFDEAIKHFQSHFSRAVVFVETAITV